MSFQSTFVPRYRIGWNLTYFWCTFWLSTSRWPTFRLIFWPLILKLVVVRFDFWVWDSNHNIWSKSAQNSLGKLFSFFTVMVEHCSFDSFSGFFFSSKNSSNNFDCQRRMRRLVFTFIFVQFNKYFFKKKLILIVPKKFVTIVLLFIELRWYIFCSH